MHTESIQGKGIWGGRARDGHIITGSLEKNLLGKGSGDPPSMGRKDFCGEGTESGAQQVLHKCSKE